MADLLILVRHGETEWSKSLRHTSTTDLSLTDDGKAAAIAVAERVQALAPTTVFSSPMQRALQTASLALPNSTPIIDDNLMEWRYGDYEGITTEQIRSDMDPNWYMWTDGCPNGESPDQVAARADAFIERVESTDGIVAAFAHGHILRVLGARWIKQEVPVGNLLSLDTASLSTVRHARGQRVIQTWNT